MGKESNAVVLKPVSGSTKEYCVFIADADLYNKWYKGEKSIAVTLFIDSFQPFVNESGSTGTWNKPSSGELASDFELYNADGTEVAWAHDETKRPEGGEQIDENQKEVSGAKGRKAKKHQEEDIVNIILARGRLQQIKHIGTGGSAMNPSRGNPTQAGTGAGSGQHR